MIFYRFFYLAEGHMIKCYLSIIMGEKRLKISDIAKDTGINRGTISRLYNETASRVELDVVDKLCDYLEIEISDLFERI